MQENTEKNAQTTTGPFQFDAARAHDGVVELHHVVTDAFVGKTVKANPAQLVGVLDGYFCSKYGDHIGLGLSIHEALTLADGSPVVDFTID